MENNPLHAVGIIALTALECVALFTGHNGEYFYAVLGAITLLSGGPSTVGAFKRIKTP
jgi:hypothetical protein